VGVSTEVELCGTGRFLEERVEAVWKEIFLAESPVRRTGEAIGFDRTSSNFGKNGPQATRPIALQTFEGTMDHRATGTIANLA